MIFSCSDPVWVSRTKKNDEKLTIFDCIVCLDVKTWNQVSSTNRVSNFDSNWVRVLIKLPVQGVSTHGRLHKSISRPTVGIWTNPLGVWSIGKRFKRIWRWNGFVTTPVTFYVNFPRKSWFWWSRQDGDDPGMNILNLMCSNGWGWWVGAQGCLERGLDPSRSNLRLKTAWDSYYSVVGVNIWSTSQVDSSTHSGCMDKPS